MFGFVEHRRQSKAEIEQPAEGGKSGNKWTLQTSWLYLSMKGNNNIPN